MSESMNEIYAHNYNDDANNSEFNSMQLFHMNQSNMLVNALLSADSTHAKRKIVDLISANCNE